MASTLNKYQQEIDALEEQISGITQALEMLIIEEDYDKHTKTLSTELYEERRTLKKRIVAPRDAQIIILVRLLDPEKEEHRQLKSRHAAYQVFFLKHEAQRDMMETLWLDSERGPLMEALGDAVLADVVEQRGPGILHCFCYSLLRPLSFGWH